MLCSVTFVVTAIRIVIGLIVIVVGTDAVGMLMRRVPVVVVVLAGGSVIVATF